MGTNKKKIQGYVAPWIADALADYQTENDLNQSQAVEEIFEFFFKVATPNPAPNDSDQQEQINELKDTIKMLERHLSALLCRMDNFDAQMEWQKMCIDSVANQILQIPTAPEPEPQPMTAQEKEEMIAAVISHVENGGSESGSEGGLSILDYLAVCINPVKTPEPEPEPVQPEPEPGLQAEAEPGLQAEAEPGPEAEVEAEPDPNVRKLSHAGLAKRLGISEPTLSKHRKSGNFENWVRNKDLQGIPWQYDPVARVYLGKLLS